MLAALVRHRVGGRLSREPAWSAAGRLAKARARDIKIVMRLKHLLYTRHFTIQGAKEQLMREMTEHQNLRAFVDEILRRHAP